MVFFLTIFISFFTCYRYKTFIKYQKKKERKEKPPAKENKESYKIFLELYIYISELPFIAV